MKDASIAYDLRTTTLQVSRRTLMCTSAVSGMEIPRSTAPEGIVIYAFVLTNLTPLIANEDVSRVPLRNGCSACMVVRNGVVGAVLGK